MRRKSAELIRFDQTFCFSNLSIAGSYKTIILFSATTPDQSNQKPTYMRRKLYSLTAGLAAALLLGAACSSDDTAENRFRNPQP